MQADGHQTDASAPVQRPVFKERIRTDFSNPFLQEMRKKRKAGQRLPFWLLQWLVMDFGTSRLSGFGAENRFKQILRNLFEDFGRVS